MADLYLDFHGVVRIAANKVDQRITDHLRGLYDRFEVSAKPDQAEVVIQPMALADYPQLDRGSIKNPDLYRLCLGGPTPLIVCDYRGKPNLVIEIKDDAIHLLYVAGVKNIGKFEYCVFLCLLLAGHRKQATLFYAAVLRQAETSMALIGLPGAGKTSLMFHMLHHGWDYLSDNTCFLTKNKAQIFRRKIGFNAYHVKMFPWLFGGLDLGLGSEAKTERRAKVRDLSIRALPSWLSTLPKLKNYYDPSIKRQPEQLFPKCTVIEETRPNAVLILAPGPQLTFQPLSEEAGLRKVAAVHELSWAEYFQPARLLSLCTDLPLLDFPAVLGNNLKGASYFRLNVPEGTGAEQIYDTFKTGLEKHIHKK